METMGPHHRLWSHVWNTLFTKNTVNWCSRDAPQELHQLCTMLNYYIFPQSLKFLMVIDQASFNHVLGLILLLFVFYIFTGLHFSASDKDLCIHLINLRRKCPVLQHFYIQAHSWSTLHIGTQLTQLSSPNKNILTFLYISLNFYQPIYRGGT